MDSALMLTLNSQFPIYLKYDDYNTF